mgnify:CR=1 FL=1
MEKNRIRPVKAGKSMRMSYSRQKEVLEMPNLIEVQKESYKWFLDEGLKEVFDDISPIADYSGHLSLEFVDFTLCEDDVKYSISECKERDATYAAPLKVKVRLYNKENDEINEHEIFMGDLPLMTETGTFVINGAERVIVSQLVRSPGIYYGIDHDKVGKELFSCTVIPNRGAWLEYETDSNDVFYVRVDRTRKVPITVLIRALGIGTNQEIIDYFGEEPKIVASFGKDVANSYEEGLLELYKKIRPGEPLTVESAQSLITAMFFDPRRYDLAKVGRYKFNKKLALRNRINGQVLAEDVVDVTTGEIIAEKGTTVTRELADAIQNAGVPFVWVQAEERNVKILSNLMVDINAQIEGIDAKETILPAVKKGDVLPLIKSEINEVERKPPKPHTEKTLLKVMETCGKKYEEKEEEQMMMAILSGFSIGTPATRAETIKKLKDAGYIKAKGKSLSCTDLGKILVETFPARELFDLEYTGRLEKTLSDIERKKFTKDDFLAMIEQFVIESVDKIKNDKVFGGPVTLEPLHTEPAGICPECGAPVVETARAFGCSGWKKGCKFAIWKDDRFITSLGKKVSYEMVKILLEHGKVGFRGCVSKRGNKFSAYFYYEKDEKTGRYNWRLEFIDTNPPQA